MSWSIVTAVIIIVYALRESHSWGIGSRRRHPSTWPLTTVHGSVRQHSLSESSWLVRLSSSASSSSSSSDADDASSPSPRLVGGVTNDDDDEAIRLLQDRARKLRQEIDAFERKKSDMEDAERRKRQQELDDRQATIDRYSVVVPILKMDGNTVEELVQFPPRLEATATDLPSEIVLCEAPLPLGILLGEHETLAGMTVVDEVLVGSNGERAGVKEGDLLRACTACKMEMEQPTWQLIAGGVGRPRTVRFMFSTDIKPFEQVMEAVGSNRMDPEGRPVLLVLERPVRQKL